MLVAAVSARGCDLADHAWHARIVLSPAPSSTGGQDGRHRGRDQRRAARPRFGRGRRRRYRSFGIPSDHRFDRLQEALAIIRDLLRQGHSTFAGTYYQTRDAELHPRGPRPAGPPVLLGTVKHGPRMLRLVAEYADMWNGDIIWDHGCQAAAIPALTAALDAACRRIGRDPATLARSITCGVAYPGHRLIVGGSDLTEKALRGSPEEIADELRAFAREGISHIQVGLAPRTVAGIDAFALVLEVLDRG